MLSHRSRNVAPTMADRRGRNRRVLRILVVEDKPFQRRLTTETLRQMRTVAVEHVENANHCVEVLPLFQPDIIVAAWDIERLRRRGHCPPHPRR